MSVRFIRGIWGIKSREVGISTRIAGASLMLRVRRGAHPTFEKVTLSTDALNQLLQL